MITSIIKSKLFRYAFAVIFWIGIWYIAALAIGSELFLPYPHTTLLAFGRLFTTSLFWKSIGNSFITILSGCIWGLLIGTTLAILSAVSTLCKSVISPMITVLRATPVASFIILIYVIVRRIKLDISTVSLWIVVIMVIPIIYVNLYTALTSFDKKLSEVAKIYRFTFWKKVRILWLPQINPYLLAALSNALGFAWKAGVAAEVICGLSHTIGQNLADSKTNLEMDQLFAWTMTVVLLSIVFEALFRLCVSRTSKKGGQMS